MLIPRQAFRLRDRQPAFPNGEGFDWIVGDGFRPLNSRCDTRSIYIINMRLTTLPHLGSPAHVMYTTLLPYFVTQDVCHLHLLDAPFDIEDADAADDYRSAMDSALQNLFG